MQTLYEIRDTDQYTIVWRPGPRCLNGLEFEISWGEIFQTPPDSPQGLQDGCPVSFLEKKRPGRQADHPPFYAAKVEYR